MKKLVALGAGLGAVGLGWLAYGALVESKRLTVERRVLKRRSWLREAWFATGKPVYRVVTRRILKWEDNEGQGPKP